MVLKGLSASKAAGWCIAPTVQSSGKNALKPLDKFLSSALIQGTVFPFFWFLHKANLHVLMMSAQIWHTTSPLQKTFTKIKHFPLERKRQWIMSVRDACYTVASLVCIYVLLIHDCSVMQQNAECKWKWGEGVSADRSSWLVIKWFACIMIAFWFVE